MAEPSPTVQLAVRELQGIPDPATRVARAFADLDAIEAEFATACQLLWDHRGRQNARACATEAGIPTSRFTLGLARASRPL